jgi:hypothetical protein
MRQGRLGVVSAWVLTLLLLSVPGRAQETRAAKPELEEKNHSRAEADGRVSLAGPALQRHD